MQDPGTLVIHQNGVAVRKFGRGKPPTQPYGAGTFTVLTTGIPGQQFFLGVSQQVPELFSFRMLFFHKQVRKVVAKSLKHPEVMIAFPSNLISPPLMSNLVSMQTLQEVCLSITSHAKMGSLFWTHEGEAGDVQQRRPSLAESSWNLGYGQFFKRIRSHERFKEKQGPNDLACN